MGRACRAALIAVGIMGLFEQPGVRVTACASRCDVLCILASLTLLPLVFVQVPAYVMHRLVRIKEAGSNQQERKRRARLLALLAALIRVRPACLPALP